MTERAKIWFDVTTLKKLRNHSPVGLTRVEANVLRGALELPQDIVGFCVFDRYRKTMEVCDRETVVKLLGQYGHAGQSGHGENSRKRSFAARFGRSLEKNIRLATRTAVAKSENAFGLSGSLGRGGSKVPWKHGDVFVLSGASWDSIDINTVTHLVSTFGLQLVAVVADLIPVLFPHQFQSSQTVEEFNRYIECVGRHAALVLSISKSTKIDFDRFCTERGIVPKRSEVIYLGAEPSSTEQTRPLQLPKLSEPNGFVLSVSTIQVRKNHQLLYQLWRRFAERNRTNIPQLVIVGSPGWLTDDLRHQWAKDPLVKNSITVLNHVNDSQLAWLYANCRYTLYPSLYEGWGLPIVESLQHGKPCIASDTSSMPEASQGLALHLDPLDFKAWLSAVEDWSSNPSILSSYEQNIRNTFQSRSWEDFGTDFCSRAVSLLTNVAEEAFV